MAAISIDDLEKRFTPRTVAQLASDDGGGVADADIVALAIAESIGVAHGILRNGWPDDDARQALIEEDIAVRGLVCRLAIAWLGCRPQTLGGSGEGNPGGPYAALGAAAEKTLKDIAAARERRTRQEGLTDTIPANAHIATGVTKVPAGADFIFLDSSRRPTRNGGF